MIEVAPGLEVKARFNTIAPPNRLVRKGHVLVMVPLPIEILALCGQIAVQWGSLENEINKIIAAMIINTPPAVDPQWAFRRFEKRLNLFRDLSAGTFQETRPLTFAFLKGCADKAADLHWRRNLIVHGTFTATLENADSVNAVFYVEGFHRGRPIRMDITQDGLEDVWTDISYLTGALSSAFKGNAPQHQLSSQERQRLRVWWANNRPPPPRGAMPVPRHVSLTPSGSLRVGRP